MLGDDKVEGSGLLEGIEGLLMSRSSGGWATSITSQGRKDMCECFTRTTLLSAPSVTTQERSTGETRDKAVGGLACLWYPWTARRCLML